MDWQRVLSRDTCSPGPGRSSDAVGCRPPRVVSVLVAAALVGAAAAVAARGADAPCSSAISAPPGSDCPATRAIQQYQRRYPQFARPPPRSIDPERQPIACARHPGTHPTWKFKSHESSLGENSRSGSAQYGFLADPGANQPDRPPHGLCAAFWIPATRMNSPDRLGYSL